MLKLLLDGSEFPECGGSEFPELTALSQTSKKQCSRCENKRSLESRRARLAINGTIVRIQRAGRLLRQAHPAEQVLKAGVGAEIINPEIRLQKPRQDGGSLLVSLFHELERSVLVFQSSIYCRNHVG